MSGKANQVEDLRALFRRPVRDEKVYSVATYADLHAKLNQNESPFDLPQPLKDEVLRRLATAAWNRYPTDYADPVREALAHRLGVSSDSILLSNGSNDLIHSVAWALVDPETPVVLPEPMFSLYRKAVRLQGGRIVPVPGHMDLSLDVDGLLEAAHRESSPLIVITNPGSPTGAWLPPEEVERLVTEAPGFVLVDEAYREFVSGGDAASLLGRAPNLLLMRTFSKAMGLAGLRIGYLAAVPELLNEIKKVRLPFVLNVLSEATALTVLDHSTFVDEAVREIRRERDWLFAELDRMVGVMVKPTQTNFLIFRTSLSSPTLVDRLAAHGVLIRDIGSYPGLEDYVRVTVGLHPENQAFLVALKHVLQPG